MSADRTGVCFSACTVLVAVLLLSAEAFAGEAVAQGIPAGGVTERILKAGDLSAEKTSTGVMREVRQCRGTITGNVVTYTLFYPPGRSGLPVLFHHYGKGGSVVDETNERIAGYGVFCVSVALEDSHCGYALQDYRDAIEDIFQRYADRIDRQNVAIMGVSYGGAVVYGMAVRFPYLFDAAIPIFGITDFGYDEEQSWWVMIAKNSPTWGAGGGCRFPEIGDRDAYHETRYLVRNAIFGAKNNPYAHFEILQDAQDGVGVPGVQAENSRRYVAELKRLGYTNFTYTETPKAGFVYPKDERLPESVWGTPVRYGHSFFRKGHDGLYHFELYVLKDALLNREWKRPPFRKTGEMFVPSFLEVPYFRFDLGDVKNNCDEAADVTYDVSSPEKYTFEITARTNLTKGTLRLRKLNPKAEYALLYLPVNTEGFVTEEERTADANGALMCTLPAVSKRSTLHVECVRK